MTDDPDGIPFDWGSDEVVQPTDIEVARLVRAVVDTVGVDVDVGEARLEGAIVFVAAPTIECVGALLDRETDTVLVLGSAVPVETYVWAYARGFALHAPNALTITSVRQPDAALAVFRNAYQPRYVRDEIAPLLTDPKKLPARIELDWPATALILDALRYSDAFDYEVNAT